MTYLGFINCASKLNWIVAIIQRVTPLTPETVPQDCNVQAVEPVALDTGVRYKTTGAVCERTGVRAVWRKPPYLKYVQTCR